MASGEFLEPGDKTIFVMPFLAQISTKDDMLVLLVVII
jgi:hypothetical protein